MRLIKENSANEKAVLFDIGANKGGYVGQLIQIFSDVDFEIHAFEPSKTTFETLANNVSDKRAILNRMGLSNETIEAVLYSDEDGSGLASLYDRQLDYYGIKLAQQEKVSLNTLDNYCRENQIEKIDFLKMDVEGNEINVLRWVLQCFKKKRYGHCSLSLADATSIPGHILGTFGICCMKIMCCLKYVKTGCIK